MALTDALSQWRSEIGAEHVITDRATLAAAERATFKTAATIPAVIRPGSREQVQECVRIAARHRTPIHCVSTGRNWGFGSRAPARDGCVLVELSRMTAIRGYDEQLAYVTVEPGVTFRALREFLQSNGSRLRVPLTGSSPDTSLIGNTLERGFGAGRLGYRPSSAAALEVVLPSGELVNTGAAAFPGASAGPVYRGGPGPELEGLFFQSNLGIVTAMSIWLAPDAPCAELCYFGIGDEVRLPSLVDGLRELLLQGVLSPIVTLRNDYSLLLTSGRRYPWRAMRDSTPLPPEILARARGLRDREAWWNTAWAGVTWLQGVSRDHASALRDLVAEALSDRADRLVFAGSDDVVVSTWEHGADLTAIADGFAGAGATRIASGSEHSNVSEAYWRKRGPLPDDLDPDRDGCGVLFCTPIVPLRGTDVVACTRLCSETALAHGLEPVLNLVVIQERAAYLSVMLVFDRDVDGEDERAIDCRDAILAATGEAGFVEHRTAIHGQIGPRRTAANRDLLLALKRATDPYGILAPGRHTD